MNRFLFAPALLLFLTQSAFAFDEKQNASAPEDELEQAQSLEKLGVTVNRTDGRVSAVELQRSSKVTPQHVKSLSQFTELTEVDIPTSLMTDEVIGHLNQIPKLKRLNIQTREGAGTFVINIETMERVKFLGVMGFDYLTDESFEAIRLPKNLEAVQFLFAPKITDKALARLHSLRKLRRLDIDCREVTDAGLLQLKDSLGMKELHLYDSAVSGTAFRDLPWIVQIEQMSWRSVATDEGVCALGRCEKLTSLDLSKSVITDAALKSLSAHRSLQSVTLDGTAVTDQGLSHLAHLRGLEVLQLYDCDAVTDSGIAYLSGLPKLRSLAVGGTQVTGAGAKKLKASLPNLSILPAQLLK